MAEHAYLNISLSQIQVFLTVAEYRNFTLASQKLNLTQSAVSKTVASLESGMQMPLFNRNKELTLTPAGKLLQQEWRHIIDNVESTITQAAFLNEQDKQIISIGKSYSLIIDEVLPQVHHFQKNFPQAMMRYEDVYFNALLKKLLIGELDAIFSLSTCCDMLQHMQVKFSVISQPVPNYVVLPKTHPMARRKKITVRELKEEKFLALSSMECQPYTDKLMSVCREHGFTPNIVATFPNVNSMMETLALSGNGVSIINPYLYDITHSALKCIPIEDAPNRLIVAWLDHNRRQKPLLDELLSQLEIPVYKN